MQKMRQEFQKTAMRDISSERSSTIVTALIDILSETHSVFSPQPTTSRFFTARIIEETIWRCNLKLVASKKPATSGRMGKGKVFEQSNHFFHTTCCFGHRNQLICFILCHFTQKKNNSVGGAYFEPLWI